jgi:hypothetical protein
MSATLIQVTETAQRELDRLASQHPEGCLRVYWEGYG